jgi:hypothetical protein
LKRWGYNDKVIESGFSKASEINRNDLLSLLGGFNSGAYSFYPNGFTEWDILKTMLRMATTG